MSDHDKLKFLGDYYGVIGEPDRAVASLQELIGKWPADYTAEGNLALIYAEKRDVTRALEIGTRVAKQHPRGSIRGSTSRCSRCSPIASPMPRATRAR